ncbi:hypothetical protein [Schlesneria paludicola]|uniref:hypothetical protein n=1 Tax=Schlesneria paludicola TaxID=360056 RepID=UPI00029AA168|nr:hypothetical protein [Schlesneria paludicola]
MSLQHFNRWLRIGVWSCFTAVLLSGLDHVAGAAENLWTVQKLNDSKPWDRFVGSPIPIRVEGRMGPFGNGQFRLMRCDVKFTIDNTKLRTVTNKASVEVTGQFKSEGSKLEFAVTDLKVVPGYLEQFDSRVAKMRLPKSQDWVELGKWASERGQFYEDADMLKKAHEAYSSAIDADYRALKSSDAAGRFELAKKINEYQLPQRRRLELMHEGFRIEWRSAQKVEPPDPAVWKKLALQITSEFPGVEIPLESIPQELRDAYEQDADSTYRNATDEQRPILQRLLLISILKKSLLFGESRDGHDGDEIAAQVEKLIPEEKGLAEKHRMARLAYGLAHVGTATRPEVEKLSASYRERGQAQNADLALLGWIKSHEPRLKGDGVPGLMQLADEYLTLLHDERSAIEYLKDAYRIDPTFEDLKAKFTSLGYQLKDSRWIKPQADRQSRAEPVAQSSAGISQGMTAAHLRRLLGEPRTVSRAMTARGTTEVWSFGPLGSTPLVVRLEQRSRDTEPKVTAFSAQ